MSIPPDFYTHDLDAAASFADRAISRLKNDGVPAVPQNFELWYVYYANVSPKLKEEINQILVEKSHLTEADCQFFYEKYLHYGFERETFQRAGDQINATLQDVTTVVQGVRNTTQEFTGKLKATTEKIANTDDMNDVKKLLDNITSETEKLLAYNIELEERLDRSYAAMSEIKRDMDRIRKEAITDGLTGLANRKAFDEQIARICRESNANGTIFSLLMIDIDHFKTFNDQYGHQVGDQVLRLVAMTLVNELKGQDMAARYGGEEFAVILPGTNINAGQIVAENLRRAVEQKEIVNRATGDNLGQITISVGVAQFYDKDESEELIMRTDQALYKSKKKGRNQVTVALTPHEDSNKRSAV